MEECDQFSPVVSFGQGHEWVARENVCSIGELSTGWPMDQPVCSLNFNACSKNINGGGGTTGREQVKMVKSRTLTQRVNFRGCANV